MKGDTTAKFIWQKLSTRVLLGMAAIHVMGSDGDSNPVERGVSFAPY